MNITDTLLAGVQIDAPVRQVVQGVFWTAVILDTDPMRCGLASTIRDDTHHSGSQMKEAGSLLRRTAHELCELLHSPRTLEASIGMAAFNALCEPNEACCSEANAADLILERSSGRQVAVVGHFPFAEQVREASENCWVLELQPRSGDLPAEQAPEVLPQADVVALTSTSLINHTFEGLVGLCRPDAFVILLGGSTPFSPVLFQYGVDVAAGTRIVNIPEALRAISQGATFRQIPGKRLLMMTRGNALTEDDTLCDSYQITQRRTGVKRGEKDEVRKSS